MGCLDCVRYLFRFFFFFMKKRKIILRVLNAKQKFFSSLNITFFDMSVINHSIHFDVFVFLRGVRFNK